jgi:ribosomal protein L40E
MAASGSGWKCPNCGAVNGSTATSCRMCFTARA